MAGMAGTTITVDGQHHTVVNEYETGDITTLLIRALDFSERNIDYDADLDEWFDKDGEPVRVEV